MHWNEPPTPQEALWPVWQVPWPIALTQHVLFVRSQGAVALQYGTPASVKGMPLSTRSFAGAPASAAGLPLDPELRPPELPLDPELRPPESPLDPEPLAPELDPEPPPDASPIPSLASSEVPRPPLVGELHATKTSAASDAARHPVRHGL